MNKVIRTRFAPSPTGGLHLGGVRTALYSYLYAQQQGGQFILRIEDTDQSRYVAGAEQYIIDTLNWCGIAPHEGPHIGGQYAPYRQSERKPMYKQYAMQLVEAGYAYYAFDTPAQLEEMREKNKTESNPSPQYDASIRASMCNSISLSQKEVDELLAANTPYVIRIKMPSNETVVLQDMIRGEVQFDTNLLDDKVLLKADGMPTYHLAVVVDDYLMQITHAFRGEEWLPSAPIHILLWQYLGWQQAMPQWAHLPLILKPDGNGKLSKRDGERLGFPVFAKKWHDEKTNTTNTGYEDIGFLPEAFLNMLVMLGWNEGTDQELYSLQEMQSAFDISRVHKAGAKFSYDKAKWYNAEWIKRMTDQQIKHYVEPLLQQAGLEVHHQQYLYDVSHLVKERCTLLPDFVPQSAYFYAAPQHIDTDSLQGKWNEQKKNCFLAIIPLLQSLPAFDAASIEACFAEQCSAMQLKLSDIQFPLRIMLVGGKYGPNVFKIAEMIGMNDAIGRMEKCIVQLENV